MLFHTDFRLSITQALGDQLLTSLERLQHARLNDENLLQLRELPGVYQLYLGAQFVYVGKAERNLPARLRQHMRKISGRDNISLEDVSFCCLYVAEDFSALAPENLLISRYAQSGEAPWNRNGFGNRDPGRRRDHTIIKANHFDHDFPADLEKTVEGLREGQISMGQLLRDVKKGLPFLFRYQQLPGDIASFPVTIQDLPLTADEVFRFITRHLPVSWQVVALLGYVIMYQDSPEVYASARGYYRDGRYLDAIPEIAPAGSIEEVEDPQDE